MSIALIELRQLEKTYRIPQFLARPLAVKALRGVSLSLYKGDSLGIVGESGCGKSTLAKLLMRIEDPTGGEYLLKGRPFSSYSHQELSRIMQMVFQDPYSSLNPRYRVWESIALPLQLQSSYSKKELRMKASAMMEKVGLRASLCDRYPHMFSGGQRQRIGIARSLMVNPEILICDEPVSALDISVQAQVLNLLQDLKKDLGLTLIFIGHDLSVVRHMSDRLMVMYFGETVEIGPTEEVFFRPQHPYTKALLMASPRMPNLSSPDNASPMAFRGLSGDLPSPLAPPPGCAFYSRCEARLPECREKAPKMIEGKEGVSCHLSALVKES